MNYLVTTMHGNIYLASCTYAQAVDAAEEIMNETGSATRIIAVSEKRNALAELAFDHPVDAGVWPHVRNI